MVVFFVRPSSFFIASNHPSPSYHISVSVSSRSRRLKRSHNTSRPVTAALSNRLTILDNPFVSQSSITISQKYIKISHCEDAARVPLTCYTQRGSGSSTGAHRQRARGEMREWMEAAVAANTPRGTAKRMMSLRTSDLRTSREETLTTPTTSSLCSSPENYGRHPAAPYGSS